MSNMESGEENIVYPSIVFTVKEQLYCVDSKNISGILQLPQYDPVPNAPECITGMFSYLNQVIHMFDLRLAFGMPTMEQEQDEFAQMIAQRKKDHIDWVTALEVSMETGKPFTLATDPHMCAFGQWFYSVKNVSHSIGFVLRKIEEPHRKLHETALDLTKCLHNCSDCQVNPCVKQSVKRVREEYMPTLLSLLDNTVEAFRSNLSREMALVINDDRKIAIVVDEVLSVEHLEVLTEDCGPLTHTANTCFTCARRSAKSPQIILELDIDKLLSRYDQQVSS